MIPDGADAVVMIENTQKTAEHEVEARKPVASGENVIMPGEDIQPGELILAAGSVLRTQDLGGLLAVGITQVGERIWLVTFMTYDLGYFDDETCRLEPIDNPFGPKVLPMSPDCFVTHVSRPYQGAI